METHLKEIAIRDEKYLIWLRSERCILTGQYGSELDGVEGMHIGTRGKALKSSDSETLPVLHSLHVLGHQSGEISMLRKNAPDDVLRAAFRALAREKYAEWKEGNK